ncbi:MAG: hypothetical protein ACODAJ_06160 [Planctomycetota bacterium]
MTNRRTCLVTVGGVASTVVLIVVGLAWWIWDGRVNARLEKRLDALPPDPFDGQPLRYRTTDDGFVVYAVGEDGKDDGGAVESGDDRPPDIGFRVRWLAEPR